MADTHSIAARNKALDRAKAHAPFLRDAILGFPDIAASFLADGAESAIGAALDLDGDSVGQCLRRQRRALALAVALGDLSGELALEALTGALSDFADRANVPRSRQQAPY